MPAITVGQELDDDRALAAPRPFERNFGCAANRKHIHAVDLDPGDAVRLAAAIEERLGRRALERGSHRILIVLDRVDDRKIPELGHVEGLVDLALVDGTISKVGEANAAILAILVLE